MDMWMKLNPSAYTAVWDRFSAQFAFRPSVYREDWPSINEPQPSRSYDIASAFGRDAAHAESVERNLNSKVLAAIRRCVSPTERLYALDWQHTCYLFRPHAPTLAADPATWCVPILPDGDYTLFLAVDFRFGLFGHPWEQTVCVFGQPLLQAIVADPPVLFCRVVREDGRPRGEAA